MAVEAPIVRNLKTLKIAKTQIELAYCYTHYTTFYTTNTNNKRSY